MDIRTVKQSVYHIDTIVLSVAAIGLIILFSNLTPHFLVMTNFRVIFETMAVLSILAVGINFLLVAGEIDISFVSVLELSAAVAAVASPSNTIYLIFLGIFAAFLVGLVNGFFVTKLGIPSFLVSLATMSGVQGIVMIVCNYRAVLLQNNLIPQIFYGRYFGGIATSVYWMIIVIVIAAISASKTKFGRWIYATGGNERAARLMGIPTLKVKLILFCLNGALAGLAGLILASRALSARPAMGQGYFMPAIAAPILGGALLTGGTGSVYRTALACFVLTVITNGVNLLGLEPAYRDIFMCIILLSALSVRAIQSRGIGSKV
ncbi:MAG: Ribose transport system permease protein RbsC [Firmicutes bacterium ADurb.Bin419]|uniref:ABC transporter permease n=1 Tax=Atribacter sp. TaxID=2847780 RepID=UPI0009D14D81|nr:ABC transporter permease [Atribacter sp.]OPZ93135.1 MAG: Ribose transport system permease protein RbsC [Firmicutes bacterium ADurb.Bin419]HQK84369.1 ABC transporter permease [Atribacter sp.]